MVVDNRPLQQAAWKQLLAARKRLTKATADLHRHENVDEPAFCAWTAATFPTLLTELRELATAVAEKSRLIHSVEDEAFASRSSPARIWARRQNPPPDDNPEPTAPPPTSGRPTAGAWDPFDDPDPFGQAPEGDAERDSFEQDMAAFFAAHGIDPDSPEAAQFRETLGGFLGAPSSRRGPEPAREIYRRLVQHLHPDRGGEWTPQRARLWHDVQQAWAERDVDWLSRLEVEWETAAEIIGPTSTVGRLVAALAELDAARRDADRRVRHYRKIPSWRFSLLAHQRAKLATRVEGELLAEIDRQRFVLDDLEATIAFWERSAQPRKKRRGRRGAARTQFGDIAGGADPFGDPDENPWF